LAEFSVKQFSDIDGGKGVVCKQKLNFFLESSKSRFLRHFCDTTLEYIYSYLHGCGPNAHVIRNTMEARTFEWLEFL
jgi:hypothetical protein